MDTFETVISKAIADGTAPGVAAIAIDKNGKSVYSKAHGSIGVEADAKPMTLDSVCWNASCTKLFTAVSAMQCVERGQLSLDSPINNILPEFNEEPLNQIITGFDADSKPQYKPASSAITLRHLLTHSSGLGYSGMDPMLVQWWTHMGHAADVTNTTVKHTGTMPRLYEAGQGWSYGCGFEWAGQMVERVNGNIKLGEYMQKHIFTPLGMKNTTFRPLLNPDIMSLMTNRPARNPETGKLEVDKSGIYPIVTAEDDYGGNGLYSTAADYILLLGSLLRPNSTLLTPTSLDLLFTPSLSPTSKSALNTILTTPFAGYLAPSYPLSGTETDAGDKVEYDYSPSGAVLTNASGIPGRMSQGSVYWAGFPNNYWFLDREKGVAGVWMGQSLPPGDAVVQGFYREWCEGVWAEC